jgi:hypothetical protein
VPRAAVECRLHRFTILIGKLQLIRRVDLRVQLGSYFVGVSSNSGVTLKNKSTNPAPTSTLEMISLLTRLGWMCALTTKLVCRTFLEFPDRERACHPHPVAIPTRKHPRISDQILSPSPVLTHMQKETRFFPVCPHMTPAYNAARYSAHSYPITKEQYCFSLLPLADLSPILSAKPTFCS